MPTKMDLWYQKRINYPEKGLSACAWEDQAVQPKQRDLHPSIVVLNVKKKKGIVCTYCVQVRENV